MFQARWWPWHLLCACLVTGMILLGSWQMSVAFNPGEWHGEQFSIRNFVYALQWWVFALFGVWFWYRYIRDQRAAEQAVESEESAIAKAKGLNSAAGGSWAAGGSVAGSTEQTSDPISLDAPADERRRQIFGDRASSSKSDETKSQSNDDKNNDQEVENGEQGA